MMRKRTFFIRIAWALVCVHGWIVPVFAQESGFDSKVREQLRNRIEASGQKLKVGNEPIFAIIALPRFYQQRLFEPAWFGGNGPGKNINELVSLIRSASKEGLNPRDYHLDRITAVLAEVKASLDEEKNVSYRLWVDAELLLTDSFLVLGSHYLAGRVNPESIDSEWIANRRDADLALILQKALENGTLKASLQNLLPPQHGYRNLKLMLASYKEIAANGGWRSMPEGNQIRKGDSGELIDMLKVRLSQSNDLELPGYSYSLSDSFDQDLESTVQKFQRGHGLEVNGLVDQATLSALNTPIEKYIEQIEINMERWRWLPQELGARYILVNIANFELDVVENGTQILTMNTIVGRTYRRTPVFSGLMTYLVFNPYWHVPPGIAVNDILPAVKKDVNYLAAKKIKVFQGWGEDTQTIDPGTIDWNSISAKDLPFRFRQEPGTDNALGNVKFMFPNKFDVYLHDTPAKELFLQRERGFSSGCIRIQKPIELAEYLLKNESGWTRDKINTTINKRTEQTVRLPEPIPVHILYWTAWSEGGQLQFRKDIYDRDRLLLNALREKPLAN